MIYILTYVIGLGREKGLEKRTRFIKCVEVRVKVLICFKSFQKRMHKCLYTPEGK